MRKLIQEGSVKNLWSTEKAGEIDFEFSDAYSVFDWGRMPDLLPGKGKALGEIGVFFFQKLAEPAPWVEFFKSADASVIRQGAKLGISGETLLRTADQFTRNGLNSHFVRPINERTFRVRSAQVFPPKAVSYYGNPEFVYPIRDYLACENLKLIPLEVVFRLGVPHGSSYFSRANKTTVEALGSTWPLQENASFGFPLVEFFSKLEDTDRHLSATDAMTLAGLDKNSFDSLISKTALLALWLKDFFEKRGLKLWDGKFEWGLEPSGDIILLDSIGPDELRLTDPQTGMQLSKEFLRMIYRRSLWFKKRRSGELNAPPPALDVEQKNAAVALYEMLSNLVVKAPAASGLSETCERMETALKNTPEGWG